jgi:hypothetical protein
MSFESTRIVCAALLSHKGLIVGPRHYDAVMQKQFLAYGWTESEPEIVQGFIDQNGNFLDREEAYIVASRNGQIIKRCGGDENTLFSENLY